MDEGEDEDELQRLQDGKQDSLKEMVTNWLTKQTEKGLTATTDEWIRLQLHLMALTESIACMYIHNIYMIQPDPCIVSNFMKDMMAWNLLCIDMIHMKCHVPLFMKKWSKGLYFFNHKNHVIYKVALPAY